MPWGLKRHQQSGQLHYITFTCYHRAALLATSDARDVIVRALELARSRYGFFVVGFVVMPEHVHLLVSEPERATLAVALQVLKQTTSRKLKAIAAGYPFWQARYCDFNIWSEWKRVEKLRYMHRNPARRGLVERPEDWKWSSFRHYLLGEDVGVKIESPWDSPEFVKKASLKGEIKVSQPSQRTRKAGPPREA
jgi:putative transposase